MPVLPPYILWSWGFGAVAQLGVLVLLFCNGNLRRLPLFTSYIVLNLCQAAFLYSLYFHFASGSSTPVMVIGWTSETVTLFVRVLATTEILYLVLHAYKGIWALAWRLLALGSVAVFCCAAFDCKKDLSWALLIANRGFHLMYAVAVLSCLVLIRHYSIPLNSAYKALLGGFCFYSSIMVAAYTIGQVLFIRRWHYFDTFWSLAELLSYAAVQVVWVISLRRPLPHPADQPSLLPSSIYWKMSPELNAGLYMLNENLSRFWKVEA